MAIYREYRHKRSERWLLFYDILGAVGLVGFIVAMGLLLWVVVPQ